MPPTSQKLRNKAWQSALDRTLKHLDAHRAKMNDLSEDLKLLEKALTESTFRIDTRVDISRTEQIAWMSSTNDVWRIHYVWPADDVDEPGANYIKPLIEAPVSARWRALPAIPKLIERIGEVAAASTPASEVSDDDIPF